jgi:hypothetical protein
MGSISIESYSQLKFPSIGLRVYHHRGPSRDPGKSGQQLMVKVRAQSNSEDCASESDVLS